MIRFVSEEVVTRKNAQGHGCHENAEIHMCTKFHFHALYDLQVWEVKN